jgi:hypothetical protein
MSLLKSAVTVIGPATINGGAVSDTGTTKVNLATATQCAVTATVKFAADADGPVVLELLGSLDGTDYDSEPFLSATLPVTLNATVQVTVDVPASPLKLDARIRNPSSKAVTLAKITALVQNAS